MRCAPRCRSAGGRRRFDGCGGRLGPDKARGADLPSSPPLPSQYHWTNRTTPDGAPDPYNSFADFEASLKQSKRKLIRQERKKVASYGLDIAVETGPSLTPALADAVHGFYVDTATRRWGTDYLTRDFFRSLFAGPAASDVALVVAYDAGRPIAAALNLVGSHALFGRHWGAARGVAESLPGLHFELSYYRAIEYAIAHKLARVEAGAQGEHKIARGYLPAVTRSSSRLAHPGLAAAVDDFLIQERAEVDYVLDALTAAASPYKDGRRQG